MDNLAPEAYTGLVRESRIVEADAHGPKVLLTPDGMYVKLFRRKHLLSSSLVYPYARRFVHHARELRELGFATVEIHRLAHCRQPPRDVVWYRPLAGETLRRRLTATADGPDAEMIDTLAGLLARLHRHGVLFRSLHAGNIIVQPDARGMGLIDIADMQIYPIPLPVPLRLRNFHHLLRYPLDAARLANCFPALVEAYLTAAGLGPRPMEILRQALLRRYEQMMGTEPPAS
ncbi:MAG: toluene tolerance protein [Deltaproteobacteria bacterium]|nr:toluene tolerance protein [Candidatus Anaeroferrophillacea bacterium]